MHGDLGRLRLRESGVCGRVESGGGSGKEERGVGSWEVRRQVDCGGGGSHGRRREEERGVCVFAERETGSSGTRGVGGKVERGVGRVLCAKRGLWRATCGMRRGERERERELVGRTGDGLCAWSRVRGREERRESRAVKRGMERARTSVLTQFTSNSRFAAQSTSPLPTRSSWP